MPKVSAEHKREVRQRLLNATWQVIERDGPEGATTRAILDEADMSTGALYSYFPSKGDLFTALAEWQVEERRAQLANVDTSALEGLLPNASEEVYSLIQLVLALFAKPDESPAFTWFRSRTDTDARPALTRVNQSMLDLFGPQVRTAQDAGVLDQTLDTEALVEMLDILLMGMCQRHFTETYVTSHDRVGGVALTILMKTLLLGGQVDGNGSDQAGEADQDPFRGTEKMAVTRDTDREGGD